MGAWGEQSFENDDALEFCDQFVSGGVGEIQKILAITADPGDYLEADQCSMAIAAAELVAAARDGDVSQLPETVAENFHSQRSGIAALKLESLAQRALRRVLGKSELRELWEEGGTDYAKPWNDSVTSLIARLEQHPVREDP